MKQTLLQRSCCNSLASQLTPNFHEEFTSGLVSSSVACLVQHLVPPPGKGSTGVFVAVDPQLHRRAIKVILEHRIVPRDTYIVFIGLLLYVLGARGNTWTLLIWLGKSNERKDNKVLRHLKEKKAIQSGKPRRVREALQKTMQGGWMERGIPSSAGFLLVLSRVFFIGSFKFK